MKTTRISAILRAPLVMERGIYSAGGSTGSVRLNLERPPGHKLPGKRRFAFRSRSPLDGAGRSSGWHSSENISSWPREASWSTQWTVGRALFLAVLLNLAATLCPLQAAVFNEHHTFDTFTPQPSLEIPDGNAAGASDHRSINSAITSIQSVEVTLEISGDFNGDLYAYLRHGSQVCVLLNRPGRSADLPFGYEDSGLNVVFSDSAANGDIHNYRTTLAPGAGSPLTLTWQPDARLVDPGLVDNLSSRSAYLSVFNGLDAGGDWTLFLADLESGGTSVVQRWELELTGVPEPAQGAMAIAACLIGGAIWRCRRKALSLCS